MATARVANDAYYTDPKLALAICRRVHPLLAADNQPRILEPSAGAGAFCMAARQVWGPEANLTAVEPYLPTTKQECNCVPWTQWMRNSASPEHEADCASRLWKPATPKQTQRFLKRWNVNHLVVQTIEDWSKKPGISDTEFDITIGNPPYNDAEEHLALVRPISNYVVFLLRLTFLGSQGRAERLYNKPGLRYLMSVAERPSFVEGKTDNSEYGVFVWQRFYQGKAEILPPLWVNV